MTLPPIDPYHLTDMTSQSLVEPSKSRSNVGSGDIRGNTLTKPRDVPSQDEANEIMDRGKR